MRKGSGVNRNWWNFMVCHKLKIKRGFPKRSIRRSVTFWEITGHNEMDWKSSREGWVQARIQKKNEPPQNFPVFWFYPISPRFFTTFPRFFTNKIFKVRKCERCGSLNLRQGVLEWKLLILNYLDSVLSILNL